VNAAQAKRLTVTAVVVSGVLASVQSISEGKRPSVRIGLGMAVVGGLLLVGSEYAPQVAGALAGLLLVSSLVNIGAPALDRIRKGL
jgi:hypothetical protein